MGGMLTTATHALYLHDTKSRTSVVRVVAVHHDTDCIYYTVRFRNGRERQTVRGKLLFIL